MAYSFIIFYPEMSKLKKSIIIIAIIPKIDKWYQSQVEQFIKALLVLELVLGTFCVVNGADMLFNET